MALIPIHRRIGVRFGFATVLLLSAVAVPSLIFIEHRVDEAAQGKMEAVGQAILAYVEKDVRDLVPGQPEQLQLHLASVEPIVDALRITVRTDREGELARWERHGYAADLPVMALRKPIVGRSGRILGYLDLDMDMRSEMLADLDRNRLLMLLGFACIGVVMLVSLVIGHRIGRGLRDITQASDGFARGNHDVRVRKESDDEVGLVGEAFNRMAEQIQKREEQLKKAREDAERQAMVAEASAKARGGFLAMMSHEIRTPMNGILGMATLMEDTELNEEQQDCLSTIKQSGEALMAILNDVLDFSKTEAGKMDLELIDFDLPSALEEVIHILSPLAKQKHLEFGFYMEEGTPERVNGDPGRLRQVLINLAGNAIKFTAEGSVRINVHALSSDTDGFQLRFDVVDTGIGIDAEGAARLFLPFTQADSSTTRRFGGSGLGLAICKQLVELMGGEISAEAAPTRGSIFWFTARVGRAGKVDQKVDFNTPGDLSGVAVLLVDDNETNLRVARRILGRCGLTGEDAVNAGEALEILRGAAAEDRPYQVGILDMCMPGMDGLALAKAIRQDPGIPDIRLILLSSLGRRGEARIAKEGGFDAYLTKPVRRSQLLGCLAACLGRSIARTDENQPLVTQHSLREAKRRVRVLLAEDNPVNQKVAVRMLDKLGCTTEVVGNGLDAVRVLSEHDYDLVLMDVQMPDMDGYEATELIRNQCPRSAGIPIIALTANAMSDDRERCMLAGMNDYLAKPVRPDDLEAALNRWVRKQAV